MNPVKRAPQYEDMTHCYKHPDRPAVGWCDLIGEDGERVAVGTCADCAPPPRCLPVAGAESGGDA